MLSESGIVLISATVSKQDKVLLVGPEITTRGFILVNENPELIKKIEKKVEEIAINYLAKNKYNYIDLKNQIIFELNPFIKDLTGRRPIISPIIMEIK